MAKFQVGDIITTFTASDHWLVAIDLNLEMVLNITPFFLGPFFIFGAFFGFSLCIVNKTLELSCHEFKYFLLCRVNNI